MKRREHRKYFNSLLSQIDSLDGDSSRDFWRTIDNLKEKNTNCDPPNIPAFLEHFRNLGKDPFNLTASQKSTIAELEQLEINLRTNETTDSPISIKEIRVEMNKLKHNKSAGPDQVINEILKASSDAILPALATLFNAILNSGIYPSGWNFAFIRQLHKKGNKLDPNNYRGITLSSCLAKLFNSILNTRLGEYVKDKQNIYKFGFRQGTRTSDSLFVLRTLVKKYTRPKNKLVACFVDFQKAFDTVWRPGLLYKLAKTQVGAKFYSIIKSMYSNTECALLTSQGYTDVFKTEIAGSGSNKEIH